jgi:DNA-binding transcriptional LysR family regulator
MKLRNLDLNLLVIFNELLKTKNVSRAAKNLNISQPAVSHALNRLRDYFNDDLFVRTSRGMEPTPHALNLSSPISEALVSIDRTITTQPPFTPETSYRNYIISMTDIGEIYFLPGLLKTLTKFAPHIRISTVRSSTGNLKEEMEAGSVDLAIGLIPELGSGFYQQQLFTQRYVCLFRKGHYLDRQRLKLKDFEELEYIDIVSAGTGHGESGKLLEKAGIKRIIKLSIPHFVSVAHILQQTDLVATVPEKFAQSCIKQFRLNYKFYPVELPEISVNLFWHSKFHNEPGNQWLRGLIYESFSEQEDNF